jgi:hypothetical protein
MAFNRAICFRHAESIGAAYDAIDAARCELDDLIDEALEDRSATSREPIAQAAAEFRARRGPVTVATLGHPRPRKLFPSSTGEASADTTRERERLRQRYPEAWAHGERAGLRNKKPPPDFAVWTAEERAAYFAAAHVVWLCKQSRKARAT